jgi:hypothetical protein
MTVLNYSALKVRQCDRYRLSQYPDGRRWDSDRPLKRVFVAVTLSHHGSDRLGASQVGVREAKSHTNLGS